MKLLYITYKQVSHKKKKNNNNKKKNSNIHLLGGRNLSIIFITMPTIKGVSL